MNLRHEAKNLIGTRLCNLRVLELDHIAEKNRHGLRDYYWKCLCDCGNIVIKSRRYLLNQNRPIKSCGCEATKWRKQNISKAQRVHRASFRKSTTQERVMYHHLIRLAFPDQAIEKNQRYYQKRKAIGKAYNDEKRKYLIGWRANQRRTNVEFRIASHLRNRIAVAMRRHKARKVSRTAELKFRYCKACCRRRATTGVALLPW